MSASYYLTPLFNNNSLVTTRQLRDQPLPLSVKDVTYETKHI